MNSEVTFHQIEQQQQINVQGAELDSSLGQWYDSVRDKPISAFSDEDLSVACRQGLHINYVIPTAIERLQHDPLAGDKYDGELLVALKSVPGDYWAANSAQVNRLKQLLVSIRESMEPELRSDIADLLSKLP